jgi:hypothetical protein
MSSETLKALSSNLDAAVRAVCRDPSDTALARLRADFAHVLLAGRLARTLPAPVRPWPDELLAGAPPPNILLRDRLDDLARVCRQAAELAALGDSAPRGLRVSTNDLARACLDEVPLISVARSSEPGVTPSP